MKVVAISSAKPGAGQTTSVVSLAGALASEGFTVLIVEANSRDTVAAFLSKKSETSQVIADLFGELDTASLDPQALVCESGIENISFAPGGGAALAAIASTVATQPGNGLKIKAFLAGLDNQFDYVLIACPEQCDALMVNALAASGLLIIAVTPGEVELDRVTTLLSFADMVAKSTETEINRLLLATRHDEQQDDSVAGLTTLQETFGEQLWSGFIPADEKFAEAVEQGTPICELDPKTPGAVAYRQLVSAV